MSVVFLFLNVLCVLNVFSESLDKRESDGKPARYKVPRPSVEAYPPKGILVYIPNAPGIQSFSIEMNVNKEIAGNAMFIGEVNEADDEGNWAVFVRDAPVNVGDVIHLTVKVIKYGRTYRLKGLQTKVEKFIDEVEEETVDETPATAIAKPRPDLPGAPQTIENKVTTEVPCEQSLTTVNGKSVCTQQVVVDETFKREFLFNSKKTMKDLLVAEMANSVLEPDESNFMVYTRDYNKAEIKNSTLILSPGFVTQIENDDDFTEDGFVKITNCTSEVVGACERQAYSWSIIPPILSARLTTKDVFTFRYGTIEIWAKLPSGNWIVPEIWLEQASGDYRQYNGRIFLAYALGNKKLKTENGLEIGYNIKRQGFQIGKSRPKFFNKTMSESETSDFHNYKLVWLPDSLSFYINDELMKKVKPNGFLNNNLKTSRLAPFDQEYFLTFGIHAGGRKDFMEGVTSGGKPKPWNNDDIKGLFNFWRSRTDWLHTWNHNSKLIISKIKVTSL